MRTSTSRPSGQLARDGVRGSALQLINPYLGQLAIEAADPHRGKTNPRAGAKTDDRVVDPELDGRLRARGHLDDAALLEDGRLVDTER